MFFCPVQTCFVPNSLAASHNADRARNVFEIGFSDGQLRADGALTEFRRSEIQVVDSLDLVAGL
jgi:hypothetical protein